MKQKKCIQNDYEHPSFFKSAFAIHGSVTPRVANLVLVAVLYSCFISLLHYFLLWDSIPVSPFEYAGLVMGLILVFRINAGYDRWWEARKLWGSVVNSSRNLAIIFTSYCKPQNARAIKQLIEYVAAQPYLMKNNLRQDGGIDEVVDLVPTELYTVLKAQAHKPNFISKKIAEILNDAAEKEQMSRFAFLEAEKHRAMIVDCQGACERILRTPMPFVMAIKSRRFILLFLLILPIALAEYSAALNVLVTTLVAYALLSLDRIGVELQNPFAKANLSHLPLDNICQAIESNLQELLQSTEQD